MTNPQGNCWSIREPTANAIYQKIKFFYGGREVGGTPFQTLRPNSLATG